MDWKLQTDMYIGENGEHLDQENIFVVFIVLIAISSYEIIKP